MIFLALLMGGGGFFLVYHGLIMGRVQYGLEALSYMLLGILWMFLAAGFACAAIVK